MNAVSDNLLIEKLIPVLSPSEKEDMRNYFLASEKFEKEFSDDARVKLEKHPVFGPLMKSISQEAQEANNKISKKFQKEAIFEDKWKALVEYQIQQGITYAKMGLEFKSWYDIITMVRSYLTPCFYKEYKGTDKFIGAINGMNLYLDISMGIIGEAYLAEKKQIINEDAEEIKKLNQGLEKKVAERTAELQASNSLFTNLFNNNPASIIISALRTSKIININNTFLEMFGYTDKSEVIGKTTNEMDIWAIPNERSEMIKILERDKKVFNFEVRVKTKQGESKWMSSSIIILDIAGEPCILAVTIDISKRKEAEEQLQEVNKELEAFSYSVSHDLRAPLRSVDGFTRMLEQDYASVFDDEGKRFLEMIQYNAKKMSALIDDLLAFSRLGRKEVQLSELNMNELVEGAIIDLNKATEHNCKITVENLHPAVGDYTLINQVMVNLISNGVKYSSKKDKPQVNISSTLDKNRVVYTVKDNGDGFDMKYVHKLFGVFQRLHSSDEFEGTGVGLAIVQRIIAKHGGKVWAEAEKGKGASFSFSLSVKQPALNQ